MSSCSPTYMFIFILLLNWKSFCWADSDRHYEDFTAATTLSETNSINSLSPLLNMTGPMVDMGSVKDPLNISDHAKISNDSVYMEVLRKVSTHMKPPRKILLEKKQMKNGDFEHNLRGWSCYYCWVQRVPGGYRSKFAAKVTNKGNRIGSMRTTIKVKPGLYYYTSHVKILNPTKMNVKYVYVMTHAKIFHHKRTTYQKLGETLRVQPDTRWYKVGGDVYAPNDVNSMQVYITVKNVKLPYLFDQVSCVRVDPVPNWEEEMELRIKDIRKASIEVRLKNGYLPKGYTLKILQKTDTFKWGAAVKTWLINNPHYRKYSDFIYKNFNWAVIENGLKWANNEPHKGKMNLAPAKSTVSHLLKNHIHVRGHTLFYGASDPSWVKHLRGKALLKAIKLRIKQAVGTFKNKISIWDVSNENLRSSLYEDLSKDPNITQKMFLMAHKKDPNAKLYFNENMVVKYSFGTVALEDRADLYKDAGIPLHGIGVQCHITGSFNTFIIMRRLNEIAKAGLPIFVSELTYESSSVAKRVASYEKLLRIFYSHPAVEGVMFWTVWSNGWRSTAAMLDRHFNVNAVGKLYLSLRKEWSTSPIKYDLSKRTQNFSVFLGEYQVRLVKSGRTVWKRSIQINDPNVTTTLVIAKG